MWRSFLVVYTECAAVESDETEALTFGTRQRLACVDGSHSIDIPRCLDLHLPHPAGRCVTSGRSLPSAQLRLLLLPQSSERGSTTATASCWVQQSGTWIDYSGCRTTWRVLSCRLHCRRVPPSYGKSCVGFPWDNELSSSWRRSLSRREARATGVPRQPPTWIPAYQKFTFIRSRSTTSAPRCLLLVPSPLLLPLSGTNSMNTRSTSN